MSFAPVIPLGGLAGLSFIDRTYDRQLELFTKKPELQRDIAHFREVAATLDTPEKLVGDTRALRVALGAFGLADELPKRAFIRKVIEEGTTDPRAFSRRLADPAWREFAAAMGHGDAGSNLGDPATRTDIVERYRVRAFEANIGNVDVDMRLALNFRREIARIANSDGVETAGWFRVMGSKPLRAVIEGALGLPDQFGALDVEQQRSELERLSRRRFGGDSPAVFRDPEKIEEALRIYLARAAAARGPAPDTPGLAALTILQSSSIGPATAGNLFASRLL